MLYNKDTGGCIPVAKFIPHCGKVIGQVTTKIKKREDGIINDLEYQISDTNI
jgi:hypothetical protein